MEEHFILMQAQNQTQQFCFLTIYSVTKRGSNLCVKPKERMEDNDLFRLTELDEESSALRKRPIQGRCLMQKL